MRRLFVPVLASALTFVASGTPAPGQVTNASSSAQSPTGANANSDSGTQPAPVAGVPPAPTTPPALDVDTNAVTAAVASPSPKPPAFGKAYAADLVYRFDPCVFDSPSFPGGSFEQDALVRQFLAPLQVATTFYNAQFEPVTRADKPGRYGAIVRITLGDGSELKRFITLYRAPKKFSWWTTHLDLSMVLPPEWGIDPRVTSRQRMDLEWGVKSLIKETMGQSSQLAIVLAGLSEISPSAAPDVLRTGWEARDAAWWFQLKSRLGLATTYAHLVALPDDYDAQPEKHWPLILFLHGSGERGDSLPKINKHGLPKLIAQGRKFPAVVVSPQCPDNEWWDTSSLSQLLDEVSAKYRVDPDRIYVTGLSMGGFGTWSLALAYPDRFAATVPICGGGDPPDAARLRKLPIWAFHGGKDPTVPKELSIEMVKAVRQAGGHAHLTIFPNDGHDSWTDAYNTEALYTWLFAQKRGQREVVTPGVPTKLPPTLCGRS